MENLFSYLIATLTIGIGATVTMDLWSLVRQPLLGVARPSYCMVGRWIGHMPKGVFRHKSIGSARPVKGECVAGWVAHYVTGIVFSGLLIAMFGMGWTREPTLAPALVVGLVTVAAPFFLMQPGMGAGIASWKTPKPNAARAQSLITHLIFGCGLYVSALILNSIYR